MTEQLFLRSQQSSAALPSAPDPNRAVIQINWIEGVVKTFRIQHHRIAMVTTAQFIHQKPDYGQAHDAQFASYT